MEILIYNRLCKVRKPLNLQGKLGHTLFRCLKRNG